MHELCIIRMSDLWPLVKKNRKLSVSRHPLSVVSQHSHFDLFKMAILPTTHPMFMQNSFCRLKGNPPMIVLIIFTFELSSQMYVIIPQTRKNIRKNHFKTQWRDNKNACARFSLTHNTPFEKKGIRKKHLKQLQF